MDPENDIRVGLIGFGLAGRVFHAPLIEATPAMRLASIVTRDLTRREQAARHYPRARLLGEVEELWESADDHDLVVIAVPNRDHVPLAMAAVEAGLAAVVDKPLAPSVAEGEPVVALAADRGVLLSVFHNRRWDGDFLTVRRLIEEDRLGRVLSFESRFERWRPDRRPDVWRERGDPAEGGGLLLDLGSHLIDQAMVLFGPPTHVYAETERRREGTEVDDDTFVALRHRGGERSHLWTSSVAGLAGPRLRVLGARGAYEIFGLDGQEQALASGASPTEGGLEPERAERRGTLGTEDGEVLVPTEPGDYLAYYQGIARSLRTGDPPPVEPADAVDVLRVIEAAARSARRASVERVAWDRDEGATGGGA